MQLRKKTQPSPEWLQQLPYKARKLEERLYRSASSLEAYLDERTLKNRLKKLARVITKQFLEAKRHRRLSRSSVSSTASTISGASFSSGSFRNSVPSLRDSITSQASADSMRSLSDSLTRGTTLVTPHTSSMNIHDNTAAAKQQANMASLTALKSMPEAPYSKSNVLTGSPFPSAAAGSDLSELERQKEVNAQLQKQIMDNIRQQEELVRKIQASGGNATASTAPAVAAASPSMPAPGGANQTNGNATQQGQQQRHSLTGFNMLHAAPPGINPGLMAAQAAFFNNSMASTAAGGAVGAFPPGAMASLVQTPALSNSLLAMNNHNLLQQSLAQGSQSLAAAQQRQFNFLRGSAFLANQSMMAMAMQPTATVPILPSAAATPAASLSMSMPPPNMQRNSATSVSLKEAAKKSHDDSSNAPLSPGSFNW